MISTGTVKISFQRLCNIPIIRCQRNWSNVTCNMASSASLLTNAKMSLADFVETFALPQRAKVEEGYQDPNIDELEFSTNDVIDVSVLGSYNGYPVSCITSV
jgi:hypothetical protein